MSAFYINSIRNAFSKLNQEPIIVSSPGRVNLIGEHTDYNLGFVLPAAIDKAIYLGIQKRDDGKIRIHALDLADSYETDVAGLSPSGKLWPDYLLGVLDQLQKRELLPGHFKGLNIAFGGDIPSGAGLSSSAALECATVFGIDALYDMGIDRKTMAQIAQAAENDFVGMKCGIMDQFASLFGQEGQLIQLDCRDLEFNYVPFDPEGFTVLLFDTRVKHSLASSAYNERREQCERGVELIRKAAHPEVQSLRDVSEEMLLRYVKPVDEIVYQRCTFIVAEVQRLLEGCIDLESGNLSAFGQKMYETHDGLSKLYEVSCPESDLLVDMVRNRTEVLGARMMGGGFGGCTINIVQHGAVDQLIDEVSAAYQKVTGSEMLCYRVTISDGTKILQISR